MTPDEQIVLGHFYDLRELLLTGDTETAIAWLDAAIKVMCRTSGNPANAVNVSDSIVCPSVLHLPKPHENR